MHKIPKIIHYCWVGGAPKPRSVIYCIESWKKYCPDYEIREWNESNYDFKKNQYMKEAYDEKKWGFVPDYARLDIIYQYGGIYLDTDVEIIKNIDSLLENEVFFGFENTGTEEYFINCGQGFGAIKQHNVIKQLRDFYDNISFYNPDGSLNMLPSPHYTTQMLLRFGLKCNNCNQNFSNITIYSSEVLCPKNFKTGKINITKATISIHHFTASWLDEKIKDELEYQKKMNSRYGEKLARKIMLIDSVLKKYGLEEIDAFHKEFDPNTMEALMTDNDKNFKDGEVLEVLLKGYRLKDRVIRPASVRVNKLEEETENNDNNENKGEDINE